MRRFLHRKSFTYALVLSLLLVAVHNRAAASGEHGQAVAAPQAPPAIAHQTVLERFRLYQGERTPEDLSALFSIAESTVVRQQPRIALSDGSTAVILAIKLAPVDGTAPNFSLRNATLINLQNKNNSEWVLKVLPTKGTLEAALVVAAGSGIREYPLTVAAPLPVGTKPGLQELQDFLKNPAGECAKEMDLNSDGVCDYKDDYIYTANHLYSESLTGRSKEARRQRALQRTLAVPSPVKPSPPPPVSGVVTDPNFQP